MPKVDWKAAIIDISAVIGLGTYGYLSSVSSNEPPMKNAEAAQKRADAKATRDAFFAEQKRIAESKGRTLPSKPALSDKDVKAPEPSLVDSLVQRGHDAVSPDSAALRREQKIYQEAHPLSEGQKQLDRNKSMLNGLLYAGGWGALSMATAYFFKRRPSKFIHGPIPGVAEHNDGLKQAIYGEVDKKIGALAVTDKTTKVGELIKLGHTPEAAAQLAKQSSISMSEQNDLRLEAAKAFGEQKISPTDAWFPHLARPFKSDGTIDPKWTAAGRAELRAGFNHQSAAPSQSVAPSAPQPAAPSVAQPAAAPDMVDTSALSAATGTTKPAITDVRAKLKDKGIQHGRS